MRDDRGDGCGQGSKPWPVGSKPEGASPYGALDMEGNVWKWLADCWDESHYTHSPASNPQGPDKGDYVAQRSGSWGDGAAAKDNFRISCRDVWAPNERDNVSGFRCAASAPAAATPAETATTPMPGLVSRVLFIGDSDSWFLDRYLPRLAASAESPMSVQSKALAAAGAQLRV